MKFASLKNQKGFSLVELMIVVGIIGILATLALPRFKQFQAKAKMGEAKNILSHIYTLEQTYSLDNNTFVATENLGAGLTSPNGGNSCTLTNNGGAQQIGFRLDPCQPTSPVPRYQYATAITNGGANFVARAQSGAAANNRVCPGNTAHYYAINEANTVWGAGGTAPTATPTGTLTEPNVGNVCAN